MSNIVNATENLSGSPSPLKSSNSLDAYSRIDSTPNIGVEFAPGIQVTYCCRSLLVKSNVDPFWACIQLSALLKDPNSDNLIRDLAILGTYFLIGGILPFLKHHYIPNLKIVQLTE